MPATICGLSGGGEAIGPRLNIGTRFGAEFELRELENRGLRQGSALIWSRRGGIGGNNATRHEKASKGMSWLRTSQGMMVHISCIRQYNRFVCEPHIQSICR
jgi:hypothetical protein